MGRAIWRSTCTCWPPALIRATIFGTVPDWCTAVRISPAAVAETPSTSSTSRAWLRANVSCVPGRKNVWSNFSPGSPSFERSVITELFAWTTSRLPPPPPGPNPPPESSDGARVTVRSVPMLASGSRALSCASSRPRVSEAMTITSATPSASPETVTIVRPRLRASSLRA